MTARLDPERPWLVIGSPTTPKLMRRAWANYHAEVERRARAAEERSADGAGDTA